MSELFAFSLGMIVMVPPAMLAASHFNNRRLFELFGWIGTMCGGLIYYVLFFS